MIIRFPNMEVAVCEAAAEWLGLAEGPLAAQAKTWLQRPNATYTEADYDPAIGLVFSVGNVRVRIPNTSILWVVSTV